MLETDCKIPVETVSIEPPESYTLYGIDHAVQVMRAQGLKKWQICKALHIGDDAWRDAIFEIRKKECIENMGVRGWMTPDEKERIVMLRNAGAKLHEIAAETGRSLSAVKRVIERDKIMAAQERTECAQSASKAVPAQTTSKVPGTVTEAVRDSVSTLSAAIDIKLLQIKRMQQEIEDARTKIAELQNWLKEVEHDDGDSAE